MSMKSKQRSKRGATTIALVLVIAFCGVLPLGLLGFELVRFFVIQEELRNITDSSSLAGTAAMASAPSTPATFPSNPSHFWTYEDREAVAMAVAAYTFTQNTILENQFGLPGGSPVLNYTDAAGLTVPVTAVAAAPGNVSVLIDPSPPSPQSPPLYGAALNICLYYTSITTGTTTQVAMGVPATSIQVQAYYSDRPVFLGTASGWNNFVANMAGKFTVSAISNGGLPQIDLLLAFDTSGSMDDQTSVAFVNRFFNGQPALDTTVAAQKMCWQVQRADTLFNCLQPPVTGTGVNVFWPQNLDYASWTSQTDPEGFAVGNTTPLLFTETSGYPSNGPISTLTNGLRGNISVVSTGGATMPEQAQPPGNTALLGFASGDLNTNTGPLHNKMPYNPINGSNVGGSAYTSATIPPIFTDLVVIPSGQKIGGGILAGSIGGTTPMGTAATVTNGGTAYTFTTIAELVEASRGNLESSAALKSATMGNYTTTLGGSTAGGGHFNAYWLWVLQQAQPVNTAEAAAYNFFQTMHLSADTHFGLETFAGTAAAQTGGGVAGLTNGSGSSETTVPVPNISLAWLGTTYQSTLPFPCIQENLTNDNFTNITTSYLPPQLTSFTAPVTTTATSSNVPLQPTTQTDIADAIQVARTIMTDTSLTRSTANKAIILFTDGVPTGDNANGASLHETEGYNDAISQATLAAGPPPLPIYTIGLAQVASIVPFENNLLGDGTGAMPKGIAYDSDPNIAKYYSVQKPTDLEEAFQTIARSLCVIQ